MKKLYSKIANSRVKSYLLSHEPFFSTDDAIVTQQDYSHRFYSFFGVNEHVWEPIPIRPASRSLSRWVE